MASTRKKHTKSGKTYYEIRYKAGRDSTELTKRWYVPEGWSEKAIQRELGKVSYEFEQQCKSGEIISHKDKKKAAIQAEKEQATEDAKILTVKQYAEKVFMPGKLAGIIGEKAISEHTRVFYLNALNQHIFPTLGEWKITDITRQQLEALLLEKSTSGLSQSTLTSIYTTLDQLFAAAEDSEMIQISPMRKVKKPKRSKTEEKAQEISDGESAPTFTVEELRHILSCLEKETLQWRAYVMLVADTGCRRGEACGLRWKSVDFNKRTITIDNNLCYTPAKSGGKGVYADTPKSKKSIRTIDISEEVAELLKDLRKAQLDENIVSSYVFLQKHSAEPMHPQSPTRYFKKFEKRYGVEDFHPHKLRHTFASIAITNGADIASVSEKLGHANKGTTLKMYAHADQESIRRASEIFRNALKKHDSQEKQA